jgi:hypothetical protein
VCYIFRLTLFVQPCNKDGTCVGWNDASTLAYHCVFVTGGNDASSFGEYGATCNNSCPYRCVSYPCGKDGSCTLKARVITDGRRDNTNLTLGNGRDDSIDHRASLVERIAVALHPKQYNFDTSANVCGSGQMSTFINQQYFNSPCCNPNLPCVSAGTNLQMLPSYPQTLASSALPIRIEAYSNSQCTSLLSSWGFTGACVAGTSGVGLSSQMLCDATRTVRVDWSGPQCNGSLLSCTTSLNQVPLGSCTSANAYGIGAAGTFLSRACPSPSVLPALCGLSPTTAPTTATFLSSTTSTSAPPTTTPPSVTSILININATSVTITITFSGPVTPQQLSQIVIQIIGLTGFSNVTVIVKSVTKKRDTLTDITLSFDGESAGAAANTLMDAISFDPALFLRSDASLPLVLGYMTSLPESDTGAVVPTFLVTDINHDMRVNLLDIVLVIAGWGPCPVDAPCPGDVTGEKSSFVHVNRLLSITDLGDFKVNLLDIILFIDSWTG